MHVNHINYVELTVCLFDLEFVTYRCNFIVFNASVLYFHTVRPLLQTGRCHHLVPSLRQVVWSLNEVADQDYSWRAELMMQVNPQCSLTSLS